MRWTSLLPVVSLLLSATAALTVMRPVLDALPYLSEESDVHWITAAEDSRPRRPVEGEEINTLRAPGAVVGTQARQYTIALDESAPSAGPLAVMTPVTGPGTRAFINGVEVEGEELVPRGRAFIAAIPGTGFQRGPNRIDLTVPEAAPYQLPRAVFVGPPGPLQAAGLRHVLLQYWTMFAVVGFGLASSVLGFLSAFFARERLHLGLPSLVSLMLAGFAALALYDLPAGQMFLQPWLRAGLASASSILLLLMIASEAEPWPRSITIAFRGGVAGFAVLIGSALVSFWERESGLHLSHWAGTATVLLSAAPALTLALTSAAVRATWSPAQRAIAALAAFALMAAAIAEIGWLGGVVYLTAKALAGVAASLAMAACFLWIGVRVFRDVEGALQQRLGLGRIIREQQAQLAAQQEALERAAVERAVLEERERFSRDIHDGVGGSLVSLLAQARTGALKEEDLEAGLQRTLADLRLMIDALDHSHATLAAAFSTFQTRITPAFAAAGIDLAWRQAALETRALKDPSSLLHVFRILQEACTNVIRHAGASRTTITIAWNETANTLEIEVDDNGAAAAPANPSGHGLKNMTDRATKIGATFTAGPIDPAPGWRVRLHVPGK